MSPVILYDSSTIDAQKPESICDENFCGAPKFSFKQSVSEMMEKPQSLPYWLPRIIGVLAIATGILHATRIVFVWNQIRPYTSLGWHREQLLVAGVLVLIGSVFLLTRKKPSWKIQASNWSVLFAWGVAEYFRHFSVMGAAWIWVALIGASAIFVAQRRWLAAAGFIFLLTCTAAFSCLVIHAKPKHAARRLKEPVTFPEEIRFNAFRRAIYLSSGVVPKKYLGFLDERGDTANYEAELRISAIKATKLANEFAVQQNFLSRISEQEVTITFLAEGGAMMLSDFQDMLDSIHPINGVGLDNYRLGIQEYAPLAKSLDEELGTGLLRLDFNIGPWAILMRPMTFREAVAGTVLMYLHQKERTAKLLRNEGRPSLMSEPIGKQFILASLVYNSGILFSAERVEQIYNFRTADYLVEVNVLNKEKRPTLPVFPTEVAKNKLERGEAFPLQLTSWNAVYHIVQRYGAWVGVRQFSKAFDESGKYNVRPIE